MGSGQGLRVATAAAIIILDRIGRVGTFSQPEGLLDDRARQAQQVGECSNPCQRCPLRRANTLP